MIVVRRIRNRRCRLAGERANEHVNEKSGTVMCDEEQATTANERSEAIVVLFASLLVAPLIDDIDAISNIRNISNSISRFTLFVFM